MCINYKNRKERLILLLKILFLISAVFAGWFSPYYIGDFYLKTNTCDYEAYTIYTDSVDQKIVQSRYVARSNGDGRIYISNVSSLENSAGGRYHADYALIYEKSYFFNYQKITNSSSHLIYESGNSDLRPYLGPSISPGLTSSIYIFYSGKKWMVGLKDSPTLICFDKEKTDG